MKQQTKKWAVSDLQSFTPGPEVCGCEQKNLKKYSNEDTWRKRAYLTFKLPT